jgi:hypothetical protein
MITPTSGRGLADTPADLAGVVAATAAAREGGPLFELWRFLAMRLLQRNSIPLGLADRTFYGVFQRAATCVRCFQ